MKSINSIGIIGFGRFGQLVARYLRDDLDIFVNDKYDKEQKADELDVSWVSFEEACTKDIIIPSVPISSFENVLREMTEILDDDSVLIDVCSVKEVPCTLMKSILPETTQILGTHPLFGPDSASENLKGKRIVLCPIRINNKLFGKIKSYLKRKGLKLIETTPEEHDKQIAKSLNLTHFIGRALMDMRREMKLQDQQISTLGYQRLMKILETVKNDTWELFVDMNKYNKYANGVREKFLNSLMTSVPIRRDLIKEFDKSKILLLGDFFLYETILGTAEELSQTAPIPNIRIQEKKIHLGGLGTILDNIQALGGYGYPVGVVGDDWYGHCLFDELEQKNITSEAIFVENDRLTTTKVRAYDTPSQTLLTQMQSGNNSQIKTSTQEKIINSVKDKISEVNAVIVYDTGKGVLSPPLIREIIEISQNNKVKVITCPSAVHIDSFQGSDVVKMSEKLARSLTGIKPINETSIRNMGLNLLSRTSSSTLLISRKKKGVFVLEDDDTFYHSPVIGKSVEQNLRPDETFTAAFTLALERGGSIKDAVTIGNFAAGIKHGKFNGEPVTQAEILQQLQSTTTLNGDKSGSIP